MKIRVAVFLMAVAAASVSQAQERMSMIPADKQTDAQKKAVADYTELQANQGVSDATYAKAVGKWGEPGAVELATIQGYYAYLAMVMNVARITVQPNAAQPLERFPRLGK